LVIYNKEFDKLRVIYSSSDPIIKFSLLTSGELLVASYNGKIDHICPPENYGDMYETISSVDVI